ncbi:MAG TPA: DUF58 domain-containing protein [Bacteroidota bacterium]|nr:DUF58 domain-containing protein [Bacteroidota bacterium]
METVTDYRKYLHPEFVAKLTNMEIVARLVVEGFITGLHKSPYHGFSVEFAEHRQYMPGDEIRHIDWKIYGKTDRYYIKQFEEETNLKAYLLLDASRSMAFSSADRISKLTYGSYIAAALAHLMVQQRDAVGLTIYDEQVRVSMPPHSTKTYLREILRQLETLTAANKTSTANSLHHIAEQIKRRGLVIILSDLFDQPHDVVSALRHFRHKKNEVIVMQILDPLERSFAFGGEALFKDLETAEEVMTQPWHIEKAYREEMKNFVERYKRECHENNIDYVLLDTGTPFDVALIEYLHKRLRMG